MYMRISAHSYTQIYTRHISCDNYSLKININIAIDRQCFPCVMKPHVLNLIKLQRVCIKILRRVILHIIVRNRVSLKKNIGIGRS